MTPPPADAAALPGRRLPHDGYLARLLWAGFIATCVVYAVFAFDYFLGFASGRDSLWLRFMAWAVSHDYAFGRGSVAVDQHAAYANGLRFMLMHTTMAAIAMALGPFQFLNGLRSRAPGLHRAAGRVYVIAMLLGTAGNLAYLSITSFDHVYTGPPFAVGLWGLDAMVLFTGALAVLAIRRRDIPRHRAWMALNFSLLLTAPGLRILWVLYGLAAPARTQGESNLAITTYLLPICMMVGLLWWAREQLREAPAAVRALPGGWARALALAGAGTLLVLVGFLSLGFLAAGDALGPYAQLAREFLAQPVWLSLWLVALGLVLRLGPAALAGPAGLQAGLARYLLASLVTALAGMALGSAMGTAAVAGYVMLSFWWGAGVLWLMAVAGSWQAARRGHWQVARQWAATGHATALVPLLWLPSLPLWQAFAGMDLAQAWMTGAIAAFATLFLVAHYLNVEVLGATRNAPRA